jgi:hypothetical protein
VSGEGDGRGGGEGLHARAAPQVRDCAAAAAVPRGPSPNRRRLPPRPPFLAPLPNPPHPNCTPTTPRLRSPAPRSPEAYSISTGLVEVPWIVALSLLMQLVSYWLIGFKSTADAFFTMLIAMVGLSYAWATIAQWFAAFFPNVRVAQIVGGIQISLTFLFAGVFIPVTEMPAGWKGMYYVVSTAHSLRLMVLPQYYCEGGAAAGCPQIAAIVNGVPTTVDKWTFVRDARMGLDYDARWTALGWLALIGIVFRLWTMAALRFINHQKR